MKKLGILAAVAAVGTTVAFASSLSVPWFVDNAPAGNNIPGLSEGITGIVYLKSTISTPLVCSIEYYSQDGVALGPANNPAIASMSNTFTLAPNSALAFRPVAFDPESTILGGQESDVGAAVPDRPRLGVNEVLNPGASNDAKRNGSLTITWSGNPTDVQGTFVYYQTFIPPIGDSRFPSTMSFGHLLPEGI